MALQGLSSFQKFDLESFLADKRLVYQKADPWVVDGQEAGSKVTLLIMEDNTVYSKPDINNSMEQLTVKVKSVAPSTYGKLKPLATEVQITDIEKAVLYGEYRNQLSITASVSIKGA